MTFFKKSLALLLLAVSAAASALDGESVADGTYVLEINKTLFGQDHYFDLKNGDEIELPRGEFTIMSNDEGYLVTGCVSAYRGAEVKIRQMCGEKDGSIYCRTVPDWVAVSGPEDLANAKEAVEVFLKPAGKNVLKLKVTDDSFVTGGSVDRFNTDNTYRLVKDRASKCVFDN